MIRLRIAAMFTACLFLTSGIAASAGNLNVSPISVILRESSANNTVTLENRGDQEMRLEVTGFAWGETETGQMTLTPADELVFYPTLLTIPAKQHRTIRVALADAPPDPTERTYRIFFEELPSLTPVPSTNGESITFKTKIGIPIFLLPRKTVSADPDITDARYANGAYHFSLVNRGDAHVLAQNITVLAHDTAGQPVFKKTLDAWYVLAKSSRTFDLPITSAECSRVHNVSIVMHALGRPDTLRSFEQPSSCN
jgi:P pilus assembly chaperone PapD